MSNEDRQRIVITAREIPPKDFDELMKRVCAWVGEPTSVDCTSALYFDVTAAAVGWFFSICSQDNDPDEVIEALCQRVKELYLGLENGILPPDRSKWPVESKVKVTFRPLAAVKS